MTLLLCAALFASAAAPALAQDSASDHWDARITAVAGEAVVHPAGGGDAVDAAVGMPLEEGDRVTTSDDSTAEISLDGGSLITLSANSDFTLENTQRSASIFSLTLGSFLAKIQKLGSQSLSVRTPTSVAAVRGTEFGVDVEVGESHVGVFDEGRVEVRGEAGGFEILTPNQETSVARGMEPQRAVPLRRFAARRAMMRARVERLALVHRNWRPMGAAQRREARAGAIRRSREERRGESRTQGREGRRAPEERGRRVPPSRRRPAPKPRQRPKKRAPERRVPERKDSK